MERKEKIYENVVYWWFAVVAFWVFIFPIHILLYFFSGWAHAKWSIAAICQYRSAWCQGTVFGQSS